MLLGFYNFKGVLTENAYLPVYKGSSFRGVFGTALKDVVCALKRSTCEDCLLHETCVYFSIFETHRFESGAPSRISAPPHPYVIEPPLDSRTRWAAGEEFGFHLILFGKANQYLPYFVYAFERMGQRGIGKAVSGKRAGFVLNSVETDDRILFSAQDGKLQTGNPVPDLKKEELLQVKPGNIRKIRVEFLTPLRLKHQNGLTADLPFHVLIRAALRRISVLYQHFGDGEPDLDYRGLVKRAARVETEKSVLGWRDWRRYSNRQETAMQMGGIAGHVVYRGDLAEFVPLLHFCEKAHLGKQTTFGMGKFKLEIDQ